jgi:hypothetical protein
MNFPKRVNGVPIDPEVIEESRRLRNENLLRPRPLLRPWYESDGFNLLAAALAVFAAILLLSQCAGCAAVSNEGGSRVRVNNCDVIVDDTLGTMPRAHGGPRARGELGSGVQCDLWKF